MSLIFKGDGFTKMDIEDLDSDDEVRINIENYGEHTVYFVNKDELLKLKEFIDLQVEKVIENE